MPAIDFASLIRARLDTARVHASPDVVERAAAYLAVLARWNARMNLTAFDLSAPTDQAIDRLIVEPLAAAVWVRPGDRLAIDIGSGGGSPALPLKMAMPSGVRMVLIEARARRSAFLREAVRAIGLREIEVETTRVDRRWRPDYLGAADIVTLRAVRPEAELWEAIRAAGSARLRVLWFTDLVTSHKSVDRYLDLFHVEHRDASLTVMRNAEAERVGEETLG